jgi:hypothetical protein
MLLDPGMSPVYAPGPFIFIFFRIEKKTLPFMRRLFKDRTYRIQGQVAVPQYGRLKAVNDPPAA